MAPRTLAYACLAALLLAVPLASAHTSVITADGKYRMAIGNLNEPVTTYVKTGLDVILSTNNTARTPVVQNPGNLTATLIAPDGVTKLSQALTAQFGKPGSYTFTEPYVLTQPGQYTLRLTGTILGSPVDGTYNVAGKVPAMGNVTFPDSHVPTNAELMALHEQDQQAISAMTARVASLEASASKPKGAPGMEAPALLLVLAAAALAVARRN
jgi:hypothetical protein